MSRWEVLSPGLQTTVQDQGRTGWRHLGVARAGALDPSALALANRLVGNAESCAGLEIVLQGPRLCLPRPSLIALVGAHVQASWNDLPLPMGRPIHVPAGELKLGAVRDGARAWLAMTGGMDVAPTLGSRSTDLRGGFGGLHGRALRSGDVLPLGPQPVLDPVEPEAPTWWIALDTAPANASAIRYVPADCNPARIDAAHALAAQSWRVDPRSDRQGLRCSGAPIVATLPEQISAPVAPGTVQLPPDGHPIVLLADAQTVGGYPRLGHVVGVDLPRLAQLRAGEALRFEAVTADAATLLRRKRDAELARALFAVDDRLRRA